MSPLELAVRKALAKLALAFGDKLENAEESLFVYLESVRDLEPLDIDGGVSRAIRAEKFFPRPAVLRAYALEERTARTVNVRPLRFQGDDVLCALCGATRVWVRRHQQPDPDPKYFTQRVINSGQHAAKLVERTEIDHKIDCPIKRPDQPALILTKGAA